MITDKETTVRHCMGCRVLPDRSRIYLAVTNLNRRMTYVIGKGLNSAKAIVPKGTEYYTDPGEAFDKFSKVRDCYHDKKKKGAR